MKTSTRLVFQEKAEALATKIYEELLDDDRINDLCAQYAREKFVQGGFITREEMGDPKTFHTESDIYWDFNTSMMNVLFVLILNKRISL